MNAKLKTHSGAKRAKAFKSHILNSQRKDTKRKRNLRKGAYVDATCMEKLTKLLPYA